METTSWTISFWALSLCIPLKHAQDPMQAMGENKIVQLAISITSFK
jgi:hypothetical protein